MRNYYDNRPTPPVQPPKRWKGGMWEQVYARPAAPEKKKHPRRGFIIFLIALAVLIAASITAAVLLRGSFDNAVPSFGWQDQQEDEDPQETAATTIERAEPGGDARMKLNAPTGETLTLSQLYQKNIASIVSITAIGSWGGSQGTGVILSEDGYTVTNAHVIVGTRTVSVKLQDGTTLEALLVGYDEHSDLAVLKVDAKHLQPAEFGQSDALNVGDHVAAIGNPLGEKLRGTLTDGIVSAVNRNVQTESGFTMTLIQTTAALNSGNSGGALINEDGQVVGITNMKMMSDYDTIEGLGFAIPTAVAKPIVDSLISTGTVTGDAILGVTVQDHDGGGAEVYRVERKSDAYAQGIRVGDIIVEANGAEISDTQDLLEAKAGLSIGDSIEITVLRGEQRLTFTVTLMDSYEL